MRNKKGQFVKGHPTGLIISEDGRKRISLANKGKKRSEEFKRNVSKRNKGRNLAEKHYNWKGGIRKMADGYIFIYSPDHPNTTKQKYVLEHRLVMEKHLGRYLTKKEVVHHINHNPSDNRIENLMLISDNGKHTSLELKGRKRYGLRMKFIER